MAAAASVSTAVKFTSAAGWADDRAVDHTGCPAPVRSNVGRFSVVGAITTPSVRSGSKLTTLAGSVGNPRTTTIFCCCRYEFIGHKRKCCRHDADRSRKWRSNLCKQSWAILRSKRKYDFKPNGSSREAWHNEYLRISLAAKRCEFKCTFHIAFRCFVGFAEPHISPVSTSSRVASASAVAINTSFATINFHPSSEYDTTDHHKPDIDEHTNGSARNLAAGLNKRINYLPWRLG